MLSSLRFKATTRLLFVLSVVPSPQHSQGPHGDVDLSRRKFRLYSLSICGLVHSFGLLFRGCSLHVVFLGLISGFAYLYINSRVVVVHSGLEKFS